MVYPVCYLQNLLPSFPYPLTVTVHSSLPSTFFTYTTRTGPLHTY